MHMNMRDWLTGPDLCASRDVLCEPARQAGLGTEPHAHLHTAMGTADVAGSSAEVPAEATRVWLHACVCAPRLCCRAGTFATAGMPCLVGAHPGRYLRHNRVLDDVTRVVRPPAVRCRCSLCHRHRSLHARPRAQLSVGALSIGTRPICARSIDTHDRHLGVVGLIGEGIITIIT